MNTTVTTPRPDHAVNATGLHRWPRLVVGLDGSWPARAALQWAARQARATQAELCAVRVLDWPVGFHQ